jgi:SsrA-binding protein
LSNFGLNLDKGKLIISFNLTASERVFISLKIMANNINIKNRRASFEYFILDQYEAGIVLTGTEIKSLREGKASINDAYCTFKGKELFVMNMHIAEYIYGTYNNHNPKRERKLLLNSNELKKLLGKVKEKGFTIVPILLYISEKGLAKLSIALAKGKHSYDKRDTLKDKDLKREISRKERD